jgi:hypothetical protein
MSLRDEPAPEADPTPYVSKIDRRAAILWIGAAGLGGGAVVGGVAAVKGRPAKTQASAQGYGPDPDLIHPVAPWPRLMTSLQLQTSALLCDYILPASGGHPSASAVGVPDFLDEWVSAPYPEQVADRAAILGGLDFLDRLSRRKRQVSILALNPTDREEMFQALAQRPMISVSGRAEAAARLVKGPLYEDLFGGLAFYRRFRRLTIGAYYTTEAGFEDIGYVGNVALASFPGPSDEIIALLDARLKALKL